MPGLSVTELVAFFHDTNYEQTRSPSNAGLAGPKNYWLLVVVRLDVAQPVGQQTSKISFRMIDSFELYLS